MRAYSSPAFFFESIYNEYIRFQPFALLFAKEIFTFFPPLTDKKKKPAFHLKCWLTGAVDEIRTRDIHLGKVALY
ncbi:MAG: hypothetical protein IKK75_13760, partial [Clostridia bacterium]|nr:hypothetical protein [Clostridia bacterium]